MYEDSQQRMANEKQQSGLMFNALTQGSKIVGNISADSDFRIDGLIEGDLNCTGKVVIGEAGRVKGTIVCQNAEILGLMDGKIRCSQQLSLRSSGKIQGDVQTKTLIVEPGAVFNGTCSMGAAKAAEAPAKE
jgi:cytoskeletal protein CcmA (bactofilin family)